MYINLLTKETFPNRLAAKLGMGTNQFNKLLKIGKVIYISDELREKINNN